MASVGVKQLRDHLTRYLRKARNGEQVVITDRGQPVAELLPLPPRVAAARAWELVRQGKAGWTGGKPRGAARPPKPRRGLVSDAVLEDRR
jgi:prevent-host-death family protein